MVKDYYKILGIDRTASGKEIKKAYIDLVRKYHPDKNQGDEKNLEKFNEVNEAYTNLGDLDKRLNYSIQLYRNDEIKEEAKKRFEKMKKKKRKNISDKE
jgi:DnaJ-class molecular chaperone